MNQKIKEYKKNLREANKPIEEIPWGSRAGFQVMQQSYRDTAALLYAEIRAGIMPARVFGIFISGPTSKVAEVVDFVEANDGVAVDLNSWYNEIAADIEPSYGLHREFGISQFGILQRSLRHKAADLRAIEIPAPHFQEGICRNQDETVAHCKSMIEAAMGAFISVFDATKQIADAIIERELGDSITPVLVLNAGSGERQSLSGSFSKTATLEVDENTKVNEKLITSLFNTKNNTK